MADNPSRLEQALDLLSARDVAALYYGTWMMLSDIEILQAKGTRIPGGLSGRLELANLYRMRLEDELDKLRRQDPKKYALVWEWLELAQDQAVKQVSERIRRSLAS